MPDYHQPQQPWEQPGQYNQPTQGWSQPQAANPLPPRRQLRRDGKTPKQPKKPLTKRDYVIGCSIMVLLLACSICGISAIARSASGPAATPTAQAVLTTATTAATATHAIATQKPTAKPTPRPTPKPTQPPARPTPTPHHTGVNGNPWGYDFNAGNLIYQPNSAFCDYFACVSTFWTATNGYVAQCANGSYTHSGGVRGACSRDGGVLRPLYSH